MKIVVNVTYAHKQFFFFLFFFCKHWGIIIQSFQMNCSNMITCYDGNNNKNDNFQVNNHFFGKSLNNNVENRILISIFRRVRMHRKIFQQIQTATALMV